MNGSLPKHETVHKLVNLAVNIKFVVIEVNRIRGLDRFWKTIASFIIFYVPIIFWQVEKSQDTTPKSWASSIETRAVIAWLSVKHESMILLVANNFMTPNVQVVTNQLVSGEKHTLCTAPSCFWKYLYADSNCYWPIRRVLGYIESIRRIKRISPN